MPDLATVEAQEEKVVKGLTAYLGSWWNLEDIRLGGVLYVSTCVRCSDLGKS